MSNKVRLAGYTSESIVDGPGFRMTFFFQGCPIHCPHCQNPQTWDPEAGQVYDLLELQALWRANPLIDGITLSGGEPTLQLEAALKLSELAIQDGLDVILYSGHTFEELRQKNDRLLDALIASLAYLIDGPYVHELRTLNLPFRGSRNQRLVDVPESLAQQKTIVLDDSLFM